MAWEKTILCLLSALALAACSADETEGGGGGAGAAGGAGASGGSGGTGGQAQPPCGPESAASLRACVEASRYVEDLTFIAAPRPPGSAHWQAVQDLCADRFTALGFAVERHDYGTGVNVIGVKTGTSAPAEEILIGAHYDSTDDTCPGADDNATGVAGVLEAARVLSTASFERTLLVVCWDEEEDGLIGSDALAERSIQGGNQITAVFNYEMIGYFDDQPDSQSLPFGLEFIFPDAAAELAANDNRGDFIAIIPDVSASIPANGIGAHADAIGLRSIVLELAADQKGSDLFGDLRRSDHDSYWQRDYPAMMITDTSEFRNPYYHCYQGVDEVGHLDHDFATKVIQATVGSAADTLAVN